MGLDGNLHVLLLHPIVFALSPEGCTCAPVSGEVCCVWPQWEAEQCWAEGEHTVEKHLGRRVQPRVVCAALGYEWLHSLCGYEASLPHRWLLIGLHRHVVPGVYRRSRYRAGGVVDPLVVHVVYGWISVFFWHRTGRFLLGDGISSRCLCSGSSTVAGSHTSWSLYVPVRAQVSAVLSEAGNAVRLSVVCAFLAVSCNLWPVLLLWKIGDLHLVSRHRLENWGPLALQVPRIYVKLFFYCQLLSFASQGRGVRSKIVAAYFAAKASYNIQHQLSRR